MFLSSYMVPNKVLILPEPVLSPVKWGNNTDFVERRLWITSDLCLQKVHQRKGRKQNKNGLEM